MPNQTVTIAQALASNASSLQVLDTAANIAGALPNASLVARCAGFTLSAAATLGAAAADKLATLGGLFHLGGVALTVLDTVANMISAANAGGLALATTRQIEDAAYNLLNTPSSTFTNISSVILTGAPVLSMVQLTKLEALPNFAVASGSHLILLDALSAYIPVLSAHPGYFASATSVTVRLDGTQIGAAGVTSLATLASAGKSVNFVAGGSDSVLNVTASAQDLANAAASVNQVGALIGLHITLSNDGSAVTASVAAALISITAFSPAAHTLSISDTGAALTTLAAAVFGHGFAQIVVASGNFTGTAAELVDPALHLNSGVTVSMTGTAAVTCQQAAALEALPGFALASGASLTVSDTIANILTHTSVLGLASAVTVTDSETVSAANAGLLAQVAAAHPGQFSLGGHSLTVSDTAANLANLTPQTIALATGFALSASGTVTAARFTTLRDTLHVALGGNTLTIADTAAQLLGLSGNLTLAAATVLTGPASVSAANLTTLAAMPGFSTGGFALTVHDSAANVALNEAAILQITGPAATVSLTDTAPVLAATAAALDPVLSHLAAGTVLAVTDSATGIVSAASSLAQLGGVLGTLTLAGGTTVTAAQAAALLPLQSHLGLGVQLTVTGNAAAILANQAALTTLHTDNRLASVTDSADTAADVAGAGAVAALNAVGASVTIADTQSAVLGAMSALVQVNGLTAVHITDVTNPIFTLSSIATYAADKHVLSLVTNTHSIAISDTAAAIATDLASPSSVLTGITGSWTITPLSGAPLVLSQAVALTPAVAAILPHLAGLLQVTGVDLAHLGAVMALSPVPQSVTITDSAADIQADLLSGSSALLADLAHISAITVSPSGTITLDATHALATHVDDSAGSVFGLLSGATLAVTGATVAQVAGLVQLHTPPATIAVSDTAAHITTALTTPGSALLTSPATITALVVSDAGAVTLTEAQDVAANVANGALTHLSGGALDVTGVSVGQLTQVEGTAKVPTAILISDTAGDIVGGLTALVSHLANLGPITITTGIVTLSVLQAEAAHVASGVNSLASLLPGHVYAVTGAMISDIPTLAALTTAPASYAVSDSSTNLALDLASGASQWASHAVTSVTVTGGTLTLTTAQAAAIGTLSHTSALAALIPGSTVDITAVPVSQLVQFGSFASSLAPGVTLHLEVTDTALALATETAAELQQAAAINSTTLTGAGGTLTAAQLTAVAGITGLNANGITVPVQDTALAIATLGAPARALAGNAVSVVDSAGNVASQLGALQAIYAGALTIQLTGGGLTVTAATYTADHATIAAITNTACVTVTGGAAAIAAIEPGLASDPHVAAVQVTDTATNVVSNFTAIAALGAAATVTLTASGTVTAAQFTTLRDTLHLALGGNTLTIDDTAAALLGLTGSLGLAAATALSGPATVSAANLTVLAALPSFSNGGFALTVSDTAAAIALNEPAILTTATVAVVIDTGPISTSQADALALLSNAGKLAFQGGDHMLVSGSYADMIAAGNAGGVALANGLLITDTAANLVAASGHYWGGRAVTYLLSANAVLTGTQPLTLAALGSNFSANGHTLSVTDTAANVLADSGALTTLGITATVNDTAAMLGSNANALLGLGARLAAVHATDTLPVSAAVAGALAPLAAKLTGTIAVQDTAAAIDTNLFSLTTLSTHAVITASDSAVDIGAHATDLATLGSALTVSLTDTLPVLAATAAALDPVASQLAGAPLAVTDTATAIASVSNALALLGPALGTVTISGGAGVTAAQAASLLPLQTHLGGLQLAVTDNAVQIAANLSALQALHTDGRLASVTDAADSVANVTGAAAALNALGASVTISDSLSDVLGAILALGQITGLTAVTINDVPTPTFTLSSIAAYTAEAHVLSLVTNTHTIAISDTAAAIAADLASPSSVLTGIPGALTITPLSGAPLVLSQAVALTPAVAAILPHLVGSLQVTGVDLAHLGAVMALSPVPQSVTITDSAADIQADLLSGNSALLANLAHISAITVSPSGTITLDATHALATHVDDSPTSVFGLLTGATLAVTGATVAQVAGLEALHTPPLAISISDLAAAITAALTTPGSALLTSPATIVALHVSDGQPVVLTEAQDMATGVNVANAALTHLSGGALDVTGVSVGQLAAVEGTAERPTLIAISDTGAAISAAVPALLGDLSNLGPISISAGVVTLSAAQAQMANVADGPSSLVSLLPSHSYAVTGATIAQIPQLLALAIPPASIAVTDSSTNLVTDLLSGSSQWAAHSNNVTVTGGTLTLTDLQAETLGALGLNAHLGALVTGTTVDITGVPVSDLVAFAGLHANLVGNNNTLHLELADTALALATDLALGNPAETQASAYINSTTLTAAGGTLTAAQVAAVAGIPGLMTNGVGVQVQDTAAAIVGLSYAARDLLVAGTAVLDTAAHVQTELDSLQTRYNGGLTITLTDQNPSLTVTAATYGADHTTIEQITNLHCLTVTGTAAQIAAIEPSLAADTHVAAVQISDSAFNVVTNLTSIAALGSIATVTLTDSVISAALASTLVAMNLPNINYGSVVVADTGGQIAAMAESGGAAYNFLVAQGAELTGTSNVALADAVALTGISGHLNLNGQTVHIWDTAAHLLQPGALAAAQALLTTNGGLATGIYLKATGDAVTLTAANAATLLTTSGLSINNPDGSTNHLTVSDTASQLDSHFATLNADLGSLGAYVVNASTAVNDATLIDLQTLGATAGSGITLTLSDTASNIYTASLVGGASIHATSFALNANAAGISTTQAVALGGLTNFSAGGYTITVTLGSNTTLTSAQANNLGSLGAALVVAGPGEYTISGSAAALNGLTAAGATVAHVTLSDTLANIAALAPTSPLLSGAISVTDSEGLNATQATSLLALLTTPGVASGGITFNGNVETVTDTVAALQTLTASTAWTGNPGLRSHFALTAEDTVANLTNPANATFLNALPHQVLSANSMVNAGTAASLAALSHFSVGSSTLLLSDTAANLALPANSAGLALATSVTLSAASTVNAAGAETLLSLSTLHLNGSQPLTITDTPANLLDGTLSGLLASHQYVQVSLSGAQTLDAQTATALVALNGFSDPTDMHIVDSSSYLLAASASPAEAMAASVSLAGNETVSANTVLRLSEVPHFTDSGGILTLAGTDFANAPTLQAIADLGANFSEGGHSLILTQSDLALTAAEFTALTNDGGVVANGFQISAMLTPTGETDTNNLLSVTASGVSGATLHVYGGTGAPASSTVEGSSGSFIVTVPDSGTGANANFSITETVNGVESAPVVVLDQAALETAVSQALGTFASSGEIQVDTGKYINLYTAASNLVLPNAPALVYNPVSHTISLDVPNAQAITLITLGASTSPASLEISEILIKHHS